MILGYLYCIIFGALFIIMQSFFINGVHECFKGKKLVDGVSGREDYQGMIFYMIAPKFFEKHRHKLWSKNLWTCVKCMSLPYGALTFFPMVIFLFGWHWQEILLFIFDVFILVSFNWFIYKKL